MHAVGGRVLFHLNSSVVLLLTCMSDRYCPRGNKLPRSRGRNQGCRPQAEIRRVQATSRVVQGVGCPADPTPAPAPALPHDQGSYCFHLCGGSEMCCRLVSRRPHLKVILIPNAPTSKATRCGLSSTSHRPLSSEHRHPPT